MQVQETERIEFKERLTDDIYKEIIAFANTDGGTIYVGINDRGEPAGLDRVDDIYTRITNGVRDAILPDVTIFVKYTLEDGQIIKVEIGEGSYKPYYLKSKGLKPSGVFVRQGTSAVPASPEQIRQMIKNADGDVFEDFRSLEQELTFQAAAKVFARHGLDLLPEKFDTLGIRSHGLGLYTNLGLLLSDQCMHTIKAAVFSDTANTIFRDRREFTGSLLTQLDEAYEYLQLCNQTRSEITGLERMDHWDYPPEAIREALLNAIIHRDYSFSGSTLVNVNETGMEFISLGGLLAGLTVADIQHGVSQLRNRKLAEVFLRLRYIEAYGTGIRRIFAAYRDCAVQPSISVAPNSFRIVLPNMNQAMQTAPADSDISASVTPQMKAVLKHLAAHGELSDQQLQELLGIKRTRAYMLAKQMEAAGLIEISGRGTKRRLKLRQRETSSL